METIKPGKYVELAYEVFEIDNGEKASMMKFTAERPDKFVYGIEKNMLPAFEKELQGLKVGDKFHLVLAPEDAFGDIDEESIMSLDKSIFTNADGEFDSEKVFVGNILQMQTEDNYVVPGIVVEITDDKVKMDFNHPLAGKTVEYDGEVMLVRDATAEEVQPKSSCGCGCGHDHCGDDCGDGCDGCH